MPTKRQLAANRRNAEKSTGPRTRAGKTAVARNATKHGLLSREVLLPSEDEAGLMELGNRLRAELQPSGELEIAFVDRITAALWRLRRLGQIEAGLITFQRYSIQANEARREAEGYTEPADADLRRLFQPTVTDESRHAAAMNRADEAVEADRRRHFNRHRELWPDREYIFLPRADDRGPWPSFKASNDRLGRGEEVDITGREADDLVYFLAVLRARTSLGDPEADLE